MTQIRRMTGVCPQQNILFDDLSVKEHLRFVGMIKGMTGAALDAEVGDRQRICNISRNVFLRQMK